MASCAWRGALCSPGRRRARAQRSMPHSLPLPGYSGQSRVARLAIITGGLGWSRSSKERPRTEDLARRAPLRPAPGRVALVALWPEEFGGMRGGVSGQCPSPPPHRGMGRHGLRMPAGVVWRCGATDGHGAA